MSPTILLTPWLESWFILTNFGVCMAIAWSCVCRIALMDARTTRTRFRLGYAMLLTAAVSSGLSSVLWAEVPGPGQTGIGVALLYLLGIGRGNWNKQVPDYATKY